MKTSLFLMSFIAWGMASASLAAPSDPTLLTIHPTRSQFPREAALRGLNEGYAKLVIEISPDGALHDSLVIESSDRCFSDAATQLIATARYSPPRDDGPPTGTRTTVMVQFRSSGILISTDQREITDNFLRGRFEQAHPTRLATAMELDRMPVTTQVVRPLYPEELARQGLEGQATVDFYVDATGAVRMPVVVSEDHAELGNFALDAIRQWQFAPPSCGGQAVVTRVRQTFDFKPPQAVATTVSP